MEVLEIYRRDTSLGIQIRETPAKVHCSMRETGTFTHNHMLAKADAMAGRKKNC
jgi:hypothetical protein